MGNEKSERTVEEIRAEALENKLELEEIMRTGDYAECLRAELTRIYLINNLLLITAEN